MLLLLPGIETVQDVISHWGEFQILCYTPLWWLEWTKWIMYFIQMKSFLRNPEVSWGLPALLRWRRPGSSLPMSWLEKVQSLHWSMYRSQGFGCCGDLSLSLPRTCMMPHVLPLQSKALSPLTHMHIPLTLCIFRVTKMGVTGKDTSSHWLHTKTSFLCCLSLPSFPFSFLACLSKAVWLSSF